MKVTIEYRSDGLIQVDTGSARYLVTEIAFRMDGPIPVMDMSVPVEGLDAIETARPKLRTLDSAPEPDDDDA